MKRFLFLLTAVLLFLFSAGCSNDDALKQFYTSVYLNEGNYFYNSGNFDRAIERYSKAIKLDPEGEFSFNSYYFRAFSYYNKGSYGAAIKDFTAVIYMSPGFEDAYIARGNCYALKKLYTEAVSDFQDVIRMNTNNAYAYFNLANAYGSMGLPEQAVLHYGRSIAVSLDFFESGYLRRGETYNRIGSYDQAITDLTRVIDHDPDNRDAYAAREFSYRKKGMTAAARKDAERVRMLGRKVAKDYLDAANLMLANGDQEGAIRYYTRSLEMDPSGTDRGGNPGEVYLYRGQLYYYNGQYEEALNDFRTALKIAPKNWLALSDLGTCYASRKQFTQAERFFLASVRINPSNDLAVFNLGKLYADTDRPEKAVRYFTLFLKIVPEHPLAYALRAEQFYKMKEYVKTIADCDKAFGLGLKNESLYLLRAQSRIALGKNLAAIEDFGGYIRAAKEPSVGYLGRGDTYMKTGKYREAADDFRHLLSLIGNATDKTDLLTYASNRLKTCEEKIEKK